MTLRSVKAVKAENRHVRVESFDDLHGVEEMKAYYARCSQINIVSNLYPSFRGMKIAGDGVAAGLGEMEIRSRAFPSSLPAYPRLCST